MDLGDDVLLEIISLLDAHSIIKFGRCSKRFLKLSKKQHILERVKPYENYFKYQQWNKGLIEAVRRSNYVQIHFFIEKGADDFEGALSTASYMGNRSMVDYFIRLGAISWNTALSKAAEGGNRNLVDFFLDKGAKCSVQTIRGAAKSGHFELVQYLIDTCFHSKRMYLDVALSGAAFGGHKEGIEILLGLGAKDTLTAISDAARGGHKEIAQWLFELSGRRLASHLMWNACISGKQDVVDWALDLYDQQASDIFQMANEEEGLEGASKGGHHQLVQFMIKRGTTSWNNALMHASGEGHLDLVKFFIQKGATKLNDALVAASHNDHREVILYLIEKGADGFDQGLERAVDQGHKSLAGLFIDLGATNLAQIIRKIATSDSYPYPSMLKFLTERIGSGEHLSPSSNTPRKRARV